MIIVHEASCITYGSAARFEHPARVERTVVELVSRHPDWEWRMPGICDDPTLLLAHTPAHLLRLLDSEDFDEDTPSLPHIIDHARRSVGAALTAMELALVGGKKAFALMRPPGHHATADQAMGFCYLNQVAVSTLAAHRMGARVAVWDFDAHHGNGTEAILRGRTNLLFASVHQHPAYPGTGTESFGNCLNFPVPPNGSRSIHMEAMHRSWAAILAFRPDVVMVSAGFDAYVDDPVTKLSLEIEDFAQLGRWLGAAPFPAAAVLEGGYSTALPTLVNAFLGAWTRASNDIAIDE